MGEITDPDEKKEYPTNRPWDVFKYLANFSHSIWLF